MSPEVRQLQSQIDQLRRGMSALMARSRSPRSSIRTIRQAAHGLTVGMPVKVSGSGTYAAAKADTEANSRVVGIVGVVVSTDTFMLYGPGTIVAGLTGLTAGVRSYLSAATAGEVVTTAPAITVPVYDAITSTVAQVALGGGGGVAVPTEDGTVFCAKSDLSGGEWARDVDIGQNVTAKAGVLRIKSPDASGDAVVIDGALVTASGKKITVREIDICDSGTAKKMLVLGSAAY